MFPEDRPLKGKQTQEKFSDVGTGSSNRGAGKKPPWKPPTGHRTRRSLVESACVACRRRKTKCDGVRPLCGRCNHLNTPCSYETEEGESRWSALRRRIAVLEEERDALRDLYRLLRSRPEAEAAELFHRVRTSSYDDLLTVVRQFRDQNVAAHSHDDTPTPTSRTPNLPQLPPISTIFQTVDQPVVSSPTLLAGIRGSQQPRQPSVSSDAGSTSTASHSSSNRSIATSQPPSA